MSHPTNKVSNGTNQFYLSALTMAMLAAQTSTFAADNRASLKVSYFEITASAAYSNLYLL